MRLVIATRNGMKRSSCAKLWPSNATPRTKSKTASTHSIPTLAIVRRTANRFRTIMSGIVSGRAPMKNSL